MLRRSRCLVVRIYLLEHQQITFRVIQRFWCTASGNTGTRDVVLNAVLGSGSYCLPYQPWGLNGSCSRLQRTQWSHAIPTIACISPELNLSSVPGLGLKLSPTETHNPGYGAVYNGMGGVTSLRCWWKWWWELTAFLQ
jgi:hypothetical protein